MNEERKGTYMEIPYKEVYEKFLSCEKQTLLRKECQANPKTASDCSAIEAVEISCLANNLCPQTSADLVSCTNFYHVKARDVKCKIAYRNFRACILQSSEYIQNSSKK